MKGGQPEYELMLDVMHYMTHYPDRYHHPHEDLACQMLLKRSPDYRDDVEDFAQQHERIAGSGDRLVKDLNAIVDGAFMKRATVETDSETYTQTMRQHMQREEEVIFPALERLLKADDWRHITTLVDSVIDPIFGGSVDRRYAALHERIVEQAECECTPVKSKF